MWAGLLGRMFLECWRCLQGVGGVCKVWAGLLGRMFLECRRCLQGVGEVCKVWVGLIGRIFLESCGQVTALTFAFPSSSLDTTSLA